MSLFLHSIFEAIKKSNLQLYKMGLGQFFNSMIGGYFTPHPHHPLHDSTFKVLGQF